MPLVLYSPICTRAEESVLADWTSRELIGNQHMVRQAAYRAAASTTMR